MGTARNNGSLHTQWCRLTKGERKKLKAYFKKEKEKHLQLNNKLGEYEVEKLP